MTDTERIVTWGLMAFIAWELYRAPSSPSTRPATNSVDSQVPVWVQQLSNVEQREYIQEYDTTQMTTDLTENLLSIPQGPGGTPTQPGKLDFFRPTRGIFSLCG
jgi:hypothetical protein